MLVPGTCLLWLCVVAVCWCGSVEVDVCVVVVAVDEEIDVVTAVVLEREALTVFEREVLAERVVVFEVEAVVLKGALTVLVADSEVDGSVDVFGVELDVAGDVVLVAGDDLGVAAGVDVKQVA